MEIVAMVNKKILILFFCRTSEKLINKLRLRARPK